jgi:hypothetical protein
MKTTALCALLAMASPACATASFGRLEGVLKGTQPVSGAELAEVQVLRAGGEETTRAGMPLLKGDRIITGAGVRALVTFPESQTEVLLDPNSELEILNPSVLLRFGRAILSRLREAREEMKARTEYVVAAPEGTLWVMQARRDQVDYAVVRGRVRIESTRQLWPPVVYGELEQGHVSGNAPPEKQAQVGASDAQANADDLARARKAVQGGRPYVPPTEEPADTRVRLPDVRGQQAKDASALLRQLGFDVTLSTVERNNARPGTVVGQSPRGGLRVNPGGRVALLVAAEPREPVRTCVVPDLQGLNVRRALLVLRRAGLQLDGRSNTRGSAIASQDPAAGRVVACGSSVRVEMRQEPVIR